MKKYFCILLFVLLLSCCTACSDDKEQSKSTENMGKESFQMLVEDIDSELTSAKSGKYENLNIICEELRLPENDLIQSISFPVYRFAKGMTLEERLNLYKDVVFPKLYDLEIVDGSHIVDLASIREQEDLPSGRYYAYDYDYLLEHESELKDTPYIGYYNGELYQFMETSPEGVCLNMGRGTIGKLQQHCFVFGTTDFEKVQTYNCYLDDLSDSYLLMDGEKTVAEAKAEIEAYLDSHYPLVGEDNGIRNEVYEITVRKIPDSEYYVFDADRTLSYNGIRVKEVAGEKLESEVGVMAEAVLCESDKVDITLGFINCFDKGSVIKTYEEFIPFPEVMERLSYYLTGDTTFDIGYIGLEYRMFTEVVDDVTYYNWVPYWSFLAKNPKDDTVIRIYMDMETGEMQSYQL